MHGRAANFEGEEIPKQPKSSESADGASAFLRQKLNIAVTILQ
jgi:hypothetical protein